jgi:xanthine dehydrogenase molybdenum-binding subunit
MLKLSREEEFTTTRTRSACVFETRTGVKKDGTFTARHIKAIVDLGAYAHGSVIADRAQFYYSTLYKCPNIVYEGYGVYTNTAPSGQMRGFSSTAIHFPIEGEIDDIAHKLKMDPIQLRLKNHIKNGDIIPSNGYTVINSGLDECILRGMDSIDWNNRQKEPGKSGGLKKKGIGMAIMIHYASKIKPTDRSLGVATLKINDDGSILLSLGTPELGQGLRTIMAQIAAEGVGARFEDLNVSLSDTSATPWSGGVAASRTTYETGGAVLEAAKCMKQKLLQIASEILGTPENRLEIKNSNVYLKENPEERLTFGEIVSNPLVKHRGDNIIISTAKYSVPRYVAPFAAHFAEVEVDTETGQVTLLKIAAAHDVGRAIHPTSVEGQIEGGLTMGLGYALTEELTYDTSSGQPLNSSFLDYKILRTPDMPLIDPIIVEPIHPVPVYGAKGIGEHGLIPVAPAIRNAIFNATGVQINELPITPEKILKALKL